VNDLPNDETPNRAHGSVTHWIADLRDGDSRAERELWERYFRRLVGLARTKLGSLPTAAADEEDVAICAMNSLFRGFRDDRFPELQDRHNLWAVLAKITARKAINQRSHELAIKRGGGQPLAAIGPLESSRGAGIDPTDDGPGPEFLAAMREQLSGLMALLPDDRLRQIALRKLEGWTSAEIAAELGVVERTIERKLNLVRVCWAAVESAPGASLPEPGGRSEEG
jgi:DNA-directed RNA polymerase specialized sigma24 family protein